MVFTGYVSLGDVIFEGDNILDFKDQRCVKEAYTKPCELGNMIWENQLNDGSFVKVSCI